LWAVSISMFFFTAFLSRTSPADLGNRRGRPLSWWQTGTATECIRRLSAVRSLIYRFTQSDYLLFLCISTPPPFYFLSTFVDLLYLLVCICILSCITMFNSWEWCIRALAVRQQALDSTRRTQNANRCAGRDVVLIGSVEENGSDMYRCSLIITVFHLCVGLATLPPSVSQLSRSVVPNLWYAYPWGYAADRLGYANIILVIS
jgi:hypothetical protein